MIIISKDKTKCAEYNRIIVGKAYGGKGKKYAVIGSVNHHDDILEYYPDKESAVKELEKIFVEDADYKSLFVTIISFGFKYGIPEDADLVFDVRLDR